MCTLSLPVSAHPCREWRSSVYHSQNETQSCICHPSLTFLTEGTLILPGGSISTYWQWYHLSALAVISCLIDFCLVTPPASSLSQAPLPLLYWLIDSPIHLLQGRWQAGIWLFCVSAIFTACRMAAWSLWSFAQRTSVQNTPPHDTQGYCPFFVAE